MYVLHSKSHSGGKIVPEGSFLSQVMKYISFAPLVNSTLCIRSILSSLNQVESVICSDKLKKFIYVLMTIFESRALAVQKNFN